MAGQFGTQPILHRSTRVTSSAREVDEPVDLLECLACRGIGDELVLGGVGLAADRVVDLSDRGGGGSVHHLQRVQACPDPGAGVGEEQAGIVGSR